VHDLQLVAARRRLDEASWEAAYAEGQAMSFGEAIEYAMSKRGATPSSAIAEQPSSEQQGALPQTASLPLRNTQY
jgi:hypothetical protein